MANNRLNKIQNFLDDVIKCDFNIPTALGHIDPNGLVFQCENISICNNNAVDLFYGIFLDSYGFYKCYLIEFIKYNIMDSAAFKALKGKNISLKNYMSGFAVVTDDLDEFMDVAAAFCYDTKNNPDAIDRFVNKNKKDVALVVSHGNNIDAMLIDMALDTSGKSLYNIPKQGYGFIIKNKTHKVPMFNCYCDIDLNISGTANTTYRFKYTDYTDILTQFTWDEYNIKSFISAYKSISYNIAEAIDKIKDGTAKVYNLEPYWADSYNN